MSEPIDSRLRQLVHELHDAAPRPRDWDDVVIVSPRVSMRRPAWLVIAAVTAVCVVVAGIIAIGDRSSRRTPANNPTPHATPAATTESTTQTVSTTSVPVADASTTTSAVEPETLTRPVTDASICEPQSARSHQFSDDTLTLFAASREAPIPTQIIGNPSGESYDAFALVERFFTTDSVTLNGTGTVEINGNQVRIGTYSNGNGDARWQLPDGSIAYLRSRGLDQAALEAIIGRLSPRDRSAAIPGFDFDMTTGTSDFALLAEHLNTGLSGNVATVECLSPATGFVYQISAINADPIVAYGGVIDRPVPLEVGTQAGTVIVINGRADTTAPTVTDVVNADTDTWAALLTNSQTSDALATWPPPPASAPSLTDVPLMLPAAVTSGQIPATRTEYADDPPELHDYSQFWFRKGPGAVVLNIDTRPGQPPPPQDGGADVQIAGWDRAFFVEPMAAGYVQLWLAAQSGSVGIWAHGLDRNEVALLGSSLARRDADQPGWDVGSLPDGLVAVQEGWALGAASRTIRSTGDQPSLEMSIVHGVPSIVTAPPWTSTASIDLIDINGHTAVIWETADRSAVVWSPETDVTVIVGYVGTAAATIELARSVQPVDNATWQAKTTPDTTSGDGCNSMFC